MGDQAERPGVVEHRHLARQQVDLAAVLVHCQAPRQGGAGVQGTLVAGGAGVGVRYGLGICGDDGYLGLAELAGRHDACGEVVFPGNHLAGVAGAPHRREPGVFFPRVRHVGHADGLDLAGILRMDESFHE